MQTPLNASASNAGALLSNSTFEVPQFQREYSWGEDEVRDFWNDLSHNVDSESYFLGLVILTDEEEGKRKRVVDGQQRLITLSLLANAIYFEALKRGRKALADRIRADFLESINYDTDEVEPRVQLSDSDDDATFQSILKQGEPPLIANGGSVAARIAESYQYLSKKLSEDLRSDPFKRLGRWTEFLTNRLYFAVFLHPDASTAYQVYEVINTRGKELTTADLLKNYIISQTSPPLREQRYSEWQQLSKQFVADGSNNFVQYIRHVVTVQSGHVLPKDLFGFLAQRITSEKRRPPHPDELMRLLNANLAVYLQMIDPTNAGPADSEQLKIFSALNSLGVIAVRPMLLALTEVPDTTEGMLYVLRLVVRRIVVGNLGTGNVERRFGEAARKIRERGDWRSVTADFADLNPPKDAFINQLKKRSFNKAVLTFLRRSILARKVTPETEGFLHFIWTRQSPLDSPMTEEEGSFWSATIGNTFLSKLERRPKGIEDWDDFKRLMLPSAVADELNEVFENMEEWDAAAVEWLGTELAQSAGEVWY